MTARLFFLLACLAPVGVVRAQSEEEPAPIVLAVIVHPDNPVKKISVRELRAYLKMERQFWPNKKRCLLYLPGRKTKASKILLKTIYRMTRKQLQVYWMRKLFAGEIPAKPSYVPSAAAAGSQVRRAEGAISVVEADEVPRGVRVLLIDGKKPGEKDYPLIGQPDP